MTDEEAIDILQNCIADYVIGDFCCGKYCPDEDMCKNDDCYYEKAIDTVINLINKQKKAIDRMAEYIETICGCSEIARDLLYKNNYEIYLEKPSKFSKEKIKEYFMEDKE